MNEIRLQLQDVFRRVFDDDDLSITDATTAADIDGWDSMAHVNLILAVEKQFGVRFSASEIAAMQGQDVGHLARLIASKAGAAR